MQMIEETLVNRVSIMYKQVHNYKSTYLLQYVA